MIDSLVPRDVLDSFGQSASVASQPVSMQPVTAIAPVTEISEAQRISADFANELRTKVLAIELSKTRFGQSRQIEVAHRDGVAEVLETTKGSTTTSKKLYPPNEPYTKRVNSVLNEATATWKRMTIGYRRGERLLRADHLADFEHELGLLQSDLDSALIELDTHRDEVLEGCRKFLGDKIFDIKQYPDSYRGHVSVRWSVANHEPSDELLKLAPETYERERAKVQRRFEAAVEAFEQESRDQLAGLVDALLFKLNPEDGAKVTYTESATTNLREFFERFKSLGITNDAKLTELIGDAEAALGGTTMGQLKKSVSKRKAINESFQSVKNRLNELLIAAPSRSISLDDLE